MHYAFQLYQFSIIFQKCTMMHYDFQLISFLLFSRNNLCPKKSEMQFPYIISQQISQIIYSKLILIFYTISCLLAIFGAGSPP